MSQNGFFQGYNRLTWAVVALQVKHSLSCVRIRGPDELGEGRVPLATLSSLASPEVNSAGLCAPKKVAARRGRAGPGLRFTRRRCPVRAGGWSRADRTSHFSAMGTGRRSPVSSGSRARGATGDSAPLLWPHVGTACALRVQAEPCHPQADSPPGRVLRTVVGSQGRGREGRKDALSVPQRRQASASSEKRVEAGSPFRAIALTLERKPLPLGSGCGTERFGRWSEGPTGVSRRETLGDGTQTSPQ